MKMTIKGLFSTDPKILRLLSCTQTPFWKIRLVWLSNQLNQTKPIVLMFFLIPERKRKISLPPVGTLLFCFKFPLLPFKDICPVWLLWRGPSRPAKHKRLTHPGHLMLPLVSRGSWLPNMCSWWHSHCATKNTCWAAVMNLTVLLL